MTSRAGRRDYRILLAEDDHEMRKLLAEALRTDGYDVTEAPTGASLLEQLSPALLDDEATHFDLVISDIRMPLITGLEMLAGLREIACPMDFILITAFGDEETHAEAARLEAIALLDKPFELSTLRDLVDSRYSMAAASTSHSNHRHSETGNDHQNDEAKASRWRS